MEFFLPLDVEVTVDIIYDIVERIDMNRIVAFFAFMDKSPFIRRVSGFLENKKRICSSSSMQLLREVFNCDKKMWAMGHLLEIYL